MFKGIHKILSALATINPFAQQDFTPDLERVSLMYRMGFMGREAFSPRLSRELIKRALAWKENQTHIKDSVLTLDEKNKIESITFKSAFLKILLKSDSLTNSLFQWILRDKNPGDVFIQYPSISLLLLESNLSERIGRQNNILKHTEGSHPNLTLLIEGKEVEILNLDHQVELTHGYKLTLREIFEVFKNKKFDVGNLEVMREGIINWNSVHWGAWNPAKNDWEKVNLDHDLWIEELPSFEVLSHVEATQRYEINIKEGEWIVAAASTRGKLNLDFNDTHAFLELAIPDNKNHYKVYDLGKIAKKFPQNSLEMLQMLCKTSRATISYPDENVFYSYREQARYPFAITKEQGIQLLDLIKADMMLSRRGSLVYQIESENCAKWVHERLEHILGKERMPDLFWMPLLDTEPEGLVGWVFNTIKKLPQRFQVPVMTFFHIPLGAMQQTWIEEEGKRLAKSLFYHEFFDHGYVFLPARLNHKIEEQKNILAMESLLSKVVQGVFLWVQTLQSTYNQRFVKYALNYFWMKMTRFVFGKQTRRLSGISIALRGICQT